MAVISMKHFLEAGVHFGHQTKRWNPKMAPYIYGVKSGIHIIDLRQTLRKLQEAYQFVKEASADGKNMLFVGTKQSLQRIVLEEAQRCESPYINFRWLGGFLTNFSTVKQSIGRLQYFEEIAGEDVIIAHRLMKNSINSSEYILFKGGPHPNTKGMKPYDTKFTGSNYWEPDRNRKSNLEYDLQTNGATVEFWLKKKAFDINIVRKLKPLAGEAKE